jgi:hypothetical protein
LFAIFVLVLIFITIAFPAVVVVGLCSLVAFVRVGFAIFLVKELEVEIQPVSWHAVHSHTLRPLDQGNLTPG